MTPDDRAEVERIVGKNILILLIFIGASIVATSLLLEHRISALEAQVRELKEGKQR